MMEVVATAGAASTDSRDSDVVAGVRSALELLTRLSPRQLGVAGENIVNRGRVVIVTTLESDARYSQLISAVEQQLQVVNKAAAGGEVGVLPLAGCEVSIVHTQPSSAGDIVLRTEQDILSRLSPVLSTVLHSAIAGPTL